MGNKDQYGLAGLIAGVTRFNIKTGENTDPSVLLLEAEVLAALEAATPPDLVEAGKVLEGVTPGKWEYRMGDICVEGADGDDRVIAGIGKSCGARSSVYSTIPNSKPEGVANARFIAWCREGVPALIALATAQAAQIAGLEDAVDANWITHQRVVAAEAEAATLRAEVERLRGALRLLHDNVVLAFPTLADLGPVANARAALEGKA